MSSPNDPQRPDPADDRPVPGDSGTPQRPTPRATGSAQADERGRESALLADVPPSARGSEPGSRSDDSGVSLSGGDGDIVKTRAADRGSAAAISGIDIQPSEDR